MYRCSSCSFLSHDAFHRGCLPWTQFVSKSHQLNSPRIIHDLHTNIKARMHHFRILRAIWLCNKSPIPFADFPPTFHRPLHSSHIYDSFIALGTANRLTSRPAASLPLFPMTVSHRQSSYMSFMVYYVYVSQDRHKTSPVGTVRSVQPCISHTHSNTVLDWLARETFNLKAEG